MDGVIVDFEGTIKLLDPDIIWDEEHVNKFVELCPHIFKMLHEMPNAIKSVNQLKDSGKYEIYFLSTPMAKMPLSYMHKRMWIQEKFGEWADTRLILTHRKDLNIGDYLIDDRLTNGAESFTGELLHFGPANKFKNWSEILGYLL